MTFTLTILFGRNGIVRDCRIRPVFMPFLVDNKRVGVGLFRFLRKDGHVGKIWWMDAHGHVYRVYPSMDMDGAFMGETYKNLGKGFITTEKE
jgi:hypothetical protein